MPEVFEITKTAKLSPCRTYRYVLTRKWESDVKPCVVFIGLNPSTADETVDDPTIRRCIRFARDWGYGGLIMLNLFGLRSTDPKGLKTCRDPIGPDNDSFLREMCDGREVICAWGTHGSYQLRGVNVRQMIEKIPGVSLRCLGKTDGGHPKHPLYLPKIAERIDF